MNTELKNKLKAMSEDELREILNNKDQYIPETIQFVKQLLHEEDEENSSEIIENANKNNTESYNAHKKNSMGSICVICCLIICFFAVITSFYIVTQNNKKLATENAIERINKLVEEIYTVDSCYGNDFLLAKDKLVEIKTLIRENDIDGLPLSKYNAANTYISDLKTLDDFYNLYEKVNYDNELYVKEADELIRKMTNEKVINKLSEGDLLYSFADSVKHVILGKAFFTAQNYFINNNPNCTLLNVGEFNPAMSVSEQYTFILNNYANEISVYGVDRIANDEEECRKYEWIHTEMLASTVEKIQSEGGYAVFVNYYKNDDEFTLYPPTRTLYWKVGADVSADVVDGAIKYNITRYSDGKIETYNGLSTDEALNFVMLNPA